MKHCRVFASRLTPLALCQFLLLFLAAVPSGLAVDIAPLLPTPEAVPAPTPIPDLQAEEPGGDEAAPNPDDVLVESLREVRFDCFNPLPPCSPEAAVPAGHPAAPGVTNAVQALGPALALCGSDLDRAVRDALSGPFTWGDLDALLTAASNAARDFGWSLARAYAPEQELTGGVLRVEVIPVWVEDVKVEGAKWSNPERLRRPYLPYTGRTLRVRDLAGVHAFQNMHPFRRVMPSLTPGAAEGSTVYSLNVEEEKPWRVFSMYETTHSRTTGSGRFTGGFTSVAPWRTDDILTMQYSKDSEFDHLDSFAMVYRHALPWRHFFTVTALWSEQDGESDRYFTQKTKDTLLRFAYTVPLPEAWGWSQALEAGWEWRRSHARSDFSGMTFFDNTSVAAPLFLGWNGRRWDAWGMTALSLEATLGFSGLAHTDRDAYDLNRPRSDRDWLTIRPEIRRDWRLPGDFLASQRVWAQWSPDRLVDAGQYYLGGNRSVRGYRESEVSGDKGLGVSLEVQSPSLLTLFTRRGATLPDKAEPTKLVKPEVRLAAFWDWGVVKRNGRLESYERKSTVMNGAGLGVRVWWGDWVQAQVDYAWRLRDTGYRQDDRKNGFWHATVSIGF